MASKLREDTNGRLTKKIPIRVHPNNQSVIPDNDKFGEAEKCSTGQLTREYYGQTESVGKIDSHVIDDGRNRANFGEKAGIFTAL